MKKFTLALFTFLCNAGLSAAAAESALTLPDVLLADVVYELVPDPSYYYDESVKGAIGRDLQGEDSDRLMAAKADRIKTERKTIWRRHDINSCERYRAALMLATKKQEGFAAVSSVEGMRILLGRAKAGKTPRDLLQVLDSVEDIEVGFHKEFPQAAAVLANLPPEDAALLAPLLSPSRDTLGQFIAQEITRLYPKASEESRAQAIKEFEHHMFQQLQSLESNIKEQKKVPRDALPHSIGLIPTMCHKALLEIEYARKQSSKMVRDTVKAECRLFEHLTPEQRDFVVQQFESQAPHLMQKCSSRSGIQDLKAFLRDQGLDIDELSRLAKEATRAEERARREAQKKAAREEAADRARQRKLEDDARKEKELGEAFEREEAAEKARQKEASRLAAEQKEKERLAAEKKTQASWSNNKLTHHYTLIAAGLGISVPAFTQYYRDECESYNKEKEAAEKTGKTMPPFSTYFWNRLATTFKISKAIGVTAAGVATYGVYKSFQA